jgi:spore germination protein YaaH
LLYKAGRRASRHSVTVRFNVRMGKMNDLSDIERGIIVSAGCTSYSISETASLLGFLRTTVSRD